VSLASQGFKFIPGTTEKGFWHGYRLCRIVRFSESEFVRLRPLVGWFAGEGVPDMHRMTGEMKQPARVQWEPSDARRGRARAHAGFGGGDHRADGMVRVLKQVKAGTREVAPVYV